MVSIPVLTICGIVTFLVTLVVIYAGVSVARDGLRGGRK